MAANPDSILDSVKKMVGFDPDYTVFDLDIVILINSAFGSLQQLGVGADTGFVITDNTTLWQQYVSQFAYLGMVKTYIFMAVRLAFDPPANSFGITAIQDQLEQLAWRINVAAEQVTPPSDPFAVQEIEEAAAGEESVTVFQGGVMPKYFAPKVITLDYQAVVTPDASTGNVFYLTLAGNAVINAPVNGVNGEHVTIGLTSAGHVVTWGNGWNFGDAGLPDVTAGKTDIISAVYRESTNEWLAGYTPGF
jgi:hypothetical protein